MTDQEKPRICEVLGVEDMEMINKLSRTPMAADDVYIFRINLCNNEVDGDFERFTAQTLVDLAAGFIGKPGVFNCSWDADAARIFKTELKVERLLRTKAGDVYCKLIGYAFLTKCEKNRPLIEAIEANEKREVSIGCSVQNATCSVCGEEVGTCCHVKGRTYDGKLCFANLEGAVNVFEWSFVAQPAIRKPRFTEEEVAFIKRIPAAKYMSRDLISNGESTVDFWAGAPTRKGSVFVGQRVAMVPVCFVPSLLPGQSISLEDIVGGDA